MPLYDSIGQQYSKFRHPDSRIVNLLLELLKLPANSTIADIGAGTGNYSRAIAAQGFQVYAVEPSSVMRAQAIEHPHVKWFTGYAEDLPLPEASVDGVISILTIHHFSNLEKAIREMHRILRGGAMVFLTFDVRLCERLWLADYFPWLREDALGLPPLSEIAKLIELSTHRTVKAFTFMLPHDLSDLFAAAAWRRPELYLNPKVRAGISSFAIPDATLIEQGVRWLEEDLSSGRWDEKYGKVRKLSEIDAGYRFLRATLKS